MGVGYLHRAPALLTEAFERSAVAKAVARLAGGVPLELVEVNAAFCALTGWSRDELAGRPWNEHFAGLVPGAVTDRRLRRRNGTAVWVTLSAVVVPAGDEEYVLVEVVDAGGEARFRALFDSSPVCMAIADDRGRLIRVNTAYEVMLGRGREEVLGSEYAEFTHPDDRAGTERERLRVSAQPGGVAAYDNRFLRPDGTVVWAQVSLSAVDGPGGGQLLIQAEDVTDRRAAEEKAATTAEREVRRLRATLAVQREVTAAAVNRDTALRTMASRAIELFDDADGASVEIVDGDNVRAIATAGTLTPYEGNRLPIAGSLSGQVFTTGQPAHSPDTAVDGRVHDDTIRKLGIRAMLVAPLHAGQQVIGSLKITSSRPAVFDDSDEQQLALLAAGMSAALRHADDAARNLALLVERTRALDALEAAEHRFRLAFENSPLGLTLISLSDEDYGRYLHANPAITAITGYSAEELGRMTVHGLVHPDELADLEKLRGVIAEADADAEPIRRELRYRHKDGHEVWVSLRAAPVRDDYGRPLYLVNQVEDVTAQREAADRLRRQARLLELIPAAVIVRDLDGTIRWWNAGATALYGWPADAAVGKIGHRLLNTGYPSGGGLDEQLAALTRDGHWAGQLDHLTATGETVTVVSRQVMHGPDQVLEIDTDVTAARAAERALAESEQRFRAQFTHSATGQVVHALGGTLSAVNPAYAAMVGRTVEELTGMSYRELVHPDDLPTSERQIAGLYAGESDAFRHEGRLRHADGHWLDVSATMSVVRDADGRPRHLIGMITDISDRRAAEIARDQAAAALTERNNQLEAANRLKLDIIGMLGHEIGNPLSSIRGYTEVLTEDWDHLTPERRNQATAAIARQARRLDEIVHEVLAMVAIEAGAIHAVRVPVSVTDEIRRALSITDEEQLPVRGRDARVLANPGHLQQILVNLLSNAAKYGGGATSITVTTEGNRACVRVADHGPGVPPEFRPRLFERLARADRDAASVRGTGLGLYIVRGLARANQGDIAYEPNDGGGSVFVLWLELAPA